MMSSPLMLGPRDWSGNLKLGTARARIRHIEIRSPGHGKSPFRISNSSRSDARNGCIVLHIVKKCPDRSLLLRRMLSHAGHGRDWHGCPAKHTGESAGMPLTLQTDLADQGRSNTSIASATQRASAGGSYPPSSTATILPWQTDSARSTANVAICRKPSSVTCMPPSGSLSWAS